MSIEILDKLFSSVENNDVAAYMECFTEDAEYKVANNPPLVGPKAIGDFGASLIPYFNKVEHKVHNTWQTGNMIISEMDLVYHRKDGKVITVPCVDIIVLENGKVKTLKAYLDAAPVLA